VQKETGMKKNNNASKSPQRVTKIRKPDRVTIGMDLGDRTSRMCFLDEEGEVIREGSVATTKKGMTQKFGAMAHSRIALEVGTHSPWVSRLLKSFGQ
jgi:transposase